MKDYCTKAYAFNKFIRIYAATTTNLVEEARKAHETWPTATAALGRFLTASAMMSLMYKAGEHLTLIINGEGPIGEMVVEASNGTVKGSIQKPGVYLKYNNGHLAVGMAVGNNGNLTVIKDLHMREPFTSISPLQTGEIGDDFTYYFASSEQVPSSVGLGVLIDTDNTVKSAGGFIVQVMTGCPDDVLDKLEAKLKSIKPVSEMVAEGYTPLDMIKEIAGENNYEILDEALPLEYKCDCSHDRFLMKLQSLGERELENIINQDGKAEVMCHFCMKKYTFTKDELINVLNNVKALHKKLDK